MSVSSTGGHGRGGQSGRIVGDIINHGKHDRWGKPVSGQRSCRAKHGEYCRGDRSPRHVHPFTPHSSPTPHSNRQPAPLHIPLPSSMQGGTATKARQHGRAPSSTCGPPPHARPQCHLALPAHPSILLSAQGVHYHEGMAAGENTLNALCARVATRGIAQRCAWSAEAFLEE
mgnify:CR=1 FL=1